MDIGSHLLKDRNIGFGESSNLLTTGNSSFTSTKTRSEKTAFGQQKPRETRGFS